MNEDTAFDLSSRPDFFTFMHRLFTEDFMPHGHCYFWRPDVLWLTVLSDIGICLAYYAIPLTLVYFINKRKSVPFHWMFLMFGAFIFLCGTTHLIAVVTTWIPVYRFEGVVKLVTAVVSIATAIMLIPLIPRAIKLPSFEAVIADLSEKTLQLEKTNRELERFNQAALGREDRVLELKREVNNLAAELGRNPPYNLTE